MTGTIYKTLFTVIDEIIADTQDAYEIHGSRTTTRSRGQPQQRGNHLGGAYTRSTV